VYNIVPENPASCGLRWGIDFLQRQVSREKRADWNWLMAGLKTTRKPLICFLNLFL
jgi:hypothetical protein